MGPSGLIALEVAAKIKGLGLAGRESGMDLANGVLEAVGKARTRMGDGDYETFCESVLAALRGEDE